MWRKQMSWNCLRGLFKFFIFTWNTLISIIETFQTIKKLDKSRPNRSHQGCSGSRIQALLIHTQCFYRAFVLPKTAHSEFLTGNQSEEAKIKNHLTNPTSLLNSNRIESNLQIHWNLVEHPVNHENVFHVIAALHADWVSRDLFGYCARTGQGSIADQTIIPGHWVSSAYLSRRRGPETWCWIFKEDPRSDA